NHHCSGSLVQSPQFLIVDPSPDFHVRGSALSKFLQLRTMTRDDQPPVKLSESIDDEIESLIRHQCSDRQIKVAAILRASGLKEIGIDGRVNDGCLPAIVGFYPLTNEL